MEGAESELESFRQQWRSEVSGRAKDVKATSSRSAAGDAGPAQSGPGRPGKKPVPALVFESVKPESSAHHDAYEPVNFHDLDNKEEAKKLGNEHIREHVSGKNREPKSALEHYEKAVEREGQGRMGDSVDLYRRAFKLDANVHEIYKNKHFPASSNQPSKVQKQDKLTLAKSDPNDAQASTSVDAQQNVTLTLQELVDSFSTLSIEPAPPETSISPQLPCYLSEMPNEILIEIQRAAAMIDVGLLSRLAQTCKRLAYLVMTEDRIWRDLCHTKRFGFAGMHYIYACDLRGFAPIVSYPNHPLSIQPTLSITSVASLTPHMYPSFRTQFRNRTRIRFSGCYISTVNYTRPGAASQMTKTWLSPIHIVTYYRYLRFMRDGTVLSLLTTSEPADVVHYLTPEYVAAQHTGALPSAVVKDALRGRWRLSGGTYTVPLLEDDDQSSSTEDDAYVPGPGDYVREPRDASIGAGDEAEPEGVLHVETEGVVPKYMWKMQFSIGSAGRKDGTRNNKLSWKGYWSYNRLTDDWGTFHMKNDRPYYWSRVKSYGLG